ncbi:MAG: hypothetical protein RJB66_585 [Pseudomonadota bacterium]
MFAVGCSFSRGGGSASNPGASVFEGAYCSSVQSVSNGVTISGSATYQYFKPVYQGATKGLTRNGSVPFINKIRRAEVRVLDPSGTVVQCGETDDNGAFSLQIEEPSSAKIFRVEVNSRGLNNYVKASILDKGTSKSFYSIYSEVAIQPGVTSYAIPPLEAPAQVDGNSPYTNLEGGAFHIFNMILKANEFLRLNANASCSICSSFSVAPKVTIYWMKGFNPSSYFNEDSPLSFFDVSGSIESTPSLFILGGSNGNVDSADTDHFDDSVILHEYGHFLEHQYWKTFSPGGFHNGNLIIDPRLAFSEGFANFLASAVLGSSKYIDTIGSPNQPDVGVYLDLETEPAAPIDVNQATGVRDMIITKNPVGEGIYREVSVSRALYDYIDNTPSENVFDSSGVANQTTEIAFVPFSFLWLALTNTDYGLNSITTHFTSMGHFNKSLESALTAGDSSLVAGFNGARLSEFQTKDTTRYAHPLVSSGQVCTHSLVPVEDRSYGSNMYGSYIDLFRSTSMFQLTHLGGQLNLKLEYTSTSGSLDLDLYLYKEDHNLSDSGDLIAASDRALASESVRGTESVSITLSAGTYLVMVAADTSTLYNLSPTATFKLLAGPTGATYLCPAP